METRIPYLAPSRELSLLLGLMQGPASLSPGLDKELFFRMVKKNRMEPLVSQRLTEEIPGYDGDGETLLMMQQISQLGHLARLFESRGIRALSVKGPAMAMEMYDSLSLRSCHDLDFLIDVKQMDQATELLLADGWQWHEAPMLKTPKRRAENRRTMQHNLFMKNELYLELHWRLLPWDCDRFDSLWANRRYTTLGGAQIAIPSRQDQLCHQIVHNTRHGYHRLKWLADTVQLLPILEKEGDALWRQLEKDGQQLMLLITMVLLLRFKVLQLPDISLGGYHFARQEEALSVQCNQADAQLLQKAIALTDELLPLLEGTNDGEFSPAQQHYACQLPRPLFEKSVCRRWLNRLRPKPWIWEWVDLPDRWYFLYWPLRIIHKLWKILRGIK